MAILILSQRLINLISNKEIILKEVSYVIRIPDTANFEKENVIITHDDIMDYRKIHYM
jgi:hypothetical protein